jgi:CHASE2 domain-containing sensor protein
MSSDQQAETHPPAPDQPHEFIHRVRRLWPIVPLVIILFALMLSDLGDFMDYHPFSDSPCALTDMDQSSISARLYMPIARWALRYTPTPSVAIVYIDPSQDPADLLTNTCASRAFIARLIDDLNAVPAHVIAIDKYYSSNSCAEADKNGALLDAVERSRVPIVVGQATHALPETSQAVGCLAPTPRLQFNSKSKLSYGLIRLDNDDLKIPLRWPLFSDPTQPVLPPSAASTTEIAAALPPESGDSLALVTAKLVNPHIESNPVISKLLASQKDPYTTFLDLPHINGLTVLCSLEQAPRKPIDGQPADALCKPYTHPPDDLNGRQLNLAGKVVVIGDLSSLDMKPFPSSLAPFPPRQRPGVFLHANYIQALLDHRFLLEIPTALTVGLVIAYVLFVYCLYWAHDVHGEPLLSAERAGLWSLAVLAALVLLSFLVLITMSYFTPLWALWGAGVFMVFRYLEATGHHRSQHLLGHLAGHHHAASASATAVHDKPE